MTPVFFTDRDLGKRFPAILKEAGIFVEQHSDHFAPDTPDEDWLGQVARHGWIVLTHDQRIRYKANERDAVMENGLAMIVLVGKAPFPELAQAFVRTLSRLEAFLSRHSAPFIAKMYRPTPAEFTKNPAAAGRVELWLDEATWNDSR